MSRSLTIGIVSEDGGFAPIGAGVLIHAEPYVWVLTANHVVPKDHERVGVLVTDRAQGRMLGGRASGRTRSGSTTRPIGGAAWVAG